MNWKYNIIHEFKDNMRLDWAELLILPADHSYNGQALWFKIDCIGNSPRHNGKDEGLFHQEARKLLGDSDYYVCEEGEIADSDMLVNADDFSRDEFLEYVKILIREKDLPITDLIDAPIEDFKERHDHADVIHEITKNYGDNEEHTEI